MTTRVLVAGSGGQGILMAGKILANAALFEKLNVTWFPSYGAAMRGGAANCTVTISDRQIGSPIAGNVDALIVLNLMALKAYEYMLNTGGLLVLDSSNIKSRPERDDLEIVDVPVMDLESGAENKGLANIILMGVFIGRTGLLSPNAIKESIGILSPMDMQANLSAFNQGKEFSEH
jgi:2-oxoglutarate ferredoxin oxidoreductase subunit gamma